MYKTSQNLQKHVFYNEHVHMETCIREQSQNSRFFLHFTSFTLLASNMLQMEVIQNIPVRKGYTMKLKRNGTIMFIWRKWWYCTFWGYPQRGYLTLLYFKVNNQQTNFVFSAKLLQVGLESWNYKLFKDFCGYCDMVAIN